MDVSSLLDIALPVVFIIVGLVLIWLLVEVAKTVRSVRSTMDVAAGQLVPTLENVQKITKEIQPAISRMDPLVERVSLTVDAANLELLRVDSILEDVNDITSTLSNTSSAIDSVASAPLNAVNTMSERVRGILRGKRPETAVSERDDKVAAEDVSSHEDDRTTGDFGGLHDFDASRVEEHFVSHGVHVADVPEGISQEEKYFTYARPSSSEE